VGRALPQRHKLTVIFLTATVTQYVVSIETLNSSEVAVKWMVCLPAESGLRTDRPRRRPSCRSHPPVPRTRSDPAAAQR
jgi:hypothetical protein